jgi:hypothetical protein
MPDMSLTGRELCRGVGYFASWEESGSPIQDAFGKISRDSMMAKSEQILDIYQFL